MKRNPILAHRKRSRGAAAGKATTYSTEAGKRVSLRVILLPDELDSLLLMCAMTAKNVSSLGGAIIATWLDSQAARDVKRRCQQRFYDRVFKPTMKDLLCTKITCPSMLSRRRAKARH